MSTEDSRLTRARQALDSTTSDLVQYASDLADSLREVLDLVAEQVLAAQKAPEPTTNAQTDLAEATDGELLQVCFDRGLITVSTA